MDELQIYKAVEAARAYIADGTHPRAASVEAAKAHGVPTLIVHALVVNARAGCRRGADAVTGQIIADHKARASQGADDGK